MKNYHTRKISEILKEFNTSERGLFLSGVKKNLQKYGQNKLPESKVDSLAKIFLRQFQSPLIIVLILAAIIVFLTGEKGDALVILFVLFMNSIIGTFQEGKAQSTFLALKKFTKTYAVVIRNGEEEIISDEDVVPGDVLIVREGEKIPADARLFSAQSLRVEEAAITGESNPKFKTIEEIKKIDTPFSDQNNIIFKGTSVISGTGKAIVIATGKDTVIGDIAQKSIEVDEELPLKKNIAVFSRFIIIAVGVIDLIIFIIAILYGYAVEEIFSTIVAIAVSIIPEGLPIVVTLVLATGVWRMGKRNVLIKKLQAVEALGQIDVIAVDKTGTITKNELTVKEIYVNNRSFIVDGVGYEPAGEIKLGDEIVFSKDYPELILAGKSGALCSNANIIFSKESGMFKITGDPVEASTLVLAQKIGFSKDELEREMPKIDERPFDYELRYHAVLNSQGNKKIVTIVGSPEEILKISEDIWSLGETKKITKEERVNIEKIFTEMSSRGLRVVAFGIKEIPWDSLKIPQNISQIVFVGFFGILDVPREEVKVAVDRVRSAGINLVMITGDHQITAKAIGRETDIFKSGDKVISGEEIERMSEVELAKHLDRVTVFSRVSPMHKLKIIDAYKINGKIIAMTGDGVNDVLSLTAANVGVAMGKIGTEVTKESADIVLLDDNFGSIVSGIEEGRNIYKTIKRVILYLFSTSVGEVFTITGAIFLGFPLPVLAVHILWLNLVTDGFLDVSLGMEPKEEGLLKEEKLRDRTNLVDRLMLERIFFMAVTMSIGSLYIFSQYFENDLEKAWTVSMTTLAVFQWFNAWNCRSEIKSIFSMNFFKNKFLIGATMIVVSLQFLAVYNPFFQRFLQTVSLNAIDWINIITISFSIVFVEEIRKFIHRILENRKNN